MGEILNLSLTFPWQLLEMTKRVTDSTSTFDLSAKVNDAEGQIFIKNTQLHLGVIIQAQKESLLSVVENGWQCHISAISSAPLHTETHNPEPVGTDTEVCEATGDSEALFPGNNNSQIIGTEDLPAKKNEGEPDHLQQEDIGAIESDIMNIDEHESEEEINEKQKTKRQTTKRRKVHCKVRIPNVSGKRNSSTEKKKRKVKNTKTKANETKLDQGQEKKRPLEACVFCLHSFVSRSNLQKHLLKFHNVNWDTYTEGEKRGGDSILAIRHIITEIQQQNSSGTVEGDVKQVDFQAGSESYNLDRCKICQVPFSASKRSRSEHLRKTHNLSLAEYKGLDKFVTENERETFLTEKLNERKEKRNKSQFCSVCNKMFSSLASYAVHVKAMHPNNEEVLLEMEKRRSASNTSGVLMDCPLCPEVRNGKAIFRHFRDIHRKHEDFDKVMAGLQEHYKQSSLKYGRDKYKQVLLKQSAKCKFCQKEFEHRWARSRHQRKCPQNPQPTHFLHCTVCARSFSTETQLTEHKKQHVGGQEYCCEYCGSSYKNKSSLYVHLRKAHDIRMKAPNFRHTCTTCSKKFFDKNRLEEHMKRHTDVRDKICDHCGKAFKTDADVQKHIKIIHQNRYQFYCNLCGHGMAKLSYLKSHKCGRVRRIQNENENDCSTSEAHASNKKFKANVLDKANVGEENIGGRQHESVIQTAPGEAPCVVTTVGVGSLKTPTEVPRSALAMKSSDLEDIDQALMQMHSSTSQSLVAMDYSSHPAPPVPPLQHNPSHPPQTHMLLPPQLHSMPAPSHPPQHTHEQATTPYMYMPPQSMAAGCYPGLPYMGADGSQSQTGTQ